MRVTPTEACRAFVVGLAETPCEDQKCSGISEGYNYRCDACRARELCREYHIRFRTENEIIDERAIEDLARTAHEAGHTEVYDDPDQT